MIRLPIIFLFILLLSDVYAMCNETQIDINTASAEKLDALNGIGTVKAQAIIQARPFGTVDDLLNVTGIGNATLNKIKEQGLACISEEKSPIVSNFSKVNDTEVEKKQVTLSYNPQGNAINKQKEITNLTPILLNAQDIKSENNTESLKRNLPFYGLTAICVVFGALFLLKRKRKNEFN